MSKKDEAVKKLDGISRRGFASMSPERRREVAQRGGKSFAEKGEFRFNDSEKAREAVNRRWEQTKSTIDDPAELEHIEDTKEAG